MAVRRLPVSWDIPTAPPAAEIRKRVSLSGSALLVERLVPTFTGRAYVQLVRDGDIESEVERIPIREGDQLRDGRFKYVTLSVVPPVVEGIVGPGYLSDLEPFARFAVADCPGELPSRLVRPSYPLLLLSHAHTGPSLAVMRFGAAAVELYNLRLWADGDALVRLEASNGGFLAGPPVWRWETPPGGGLTSMERTHPLHVSSLAAGVYPGLEVDCGPAVNWALMAEYLPRQEA